MRSSAAMVRYRRSKLVHMRECPSEDMVLLHRRDRCPE